MQRPASASVDDSSSSQSKKCCTEDLRYPRLSHAVSAIELRGPPGVGYFASTIRNRKHLKQRRRAASSFPLNDISQNARRVLSNAEISHSKESSLSFPVSRLSKLSTTQYGSTDPESAYPSPPASDVGKSRSSSCSEVDVYRAVDHIRFPLNPVPLPALKFPEHTELRHGLRNFIPSKRSTSARSPFSTPSRSPDRYISNRLTPQAPSKTFQVSKSPDRLSVSERLYRHNSASPDPFGPLVVPRRREARTNVNPGSSPLVNYRPPRPIGTTNITTVPNPSSTQNRNASAGAVWNIGGPTLAHHAVPVRSVSDGRGGFISGGTNAPMYDSQFFNDDTSDQDLERMEARLAAALEIDQTARVLDVSRSPRSPRSVSTGGIETKRRRPDGNARSLWRHGDWMDEGSTSRESTVKFPVSKYL